MTDDTLSDYPGSLRVMARNNTHVDGRFGARLKALRLSIGVSQRELASDGVSYAYISRIESGDRTPSLSAVVMLAQRLRERAGDWLDNIEPEDFVEAEADFVEWVAALRECEQVTAHYLLTGRHDGPCLICGGHAINGGMSNEHHRNGSNGSTRR